MRSVKWVGRAKASGKRVPSLFGAAHGLDGKCPPMFAPAPKTGKLCFRACKTDRDCPNRATCEMLETKEGKFCIAHYN